MGASIYLPNMPGLRRSPGLVEIQLVKQLGCTVGKGISPLWRTKVICNEINGPHCSLLLHTLLPVALIQSSSRSTSNVGPSEFSHIPCSKSLKRSLSLLSPERTSRGLLNREYPLRCPRHFTSGLSWPTPIASSPRVTSFQRDHTWLEPRKDESLCPGCGVEMQDVDPKAPGFFQRPTQEKRGEEKDVVLDADVDHVLDISSESGVAGKEKQVEHWELASPDGPVLDLGEDAIESVRGRRTRRGSGKRFKAGKFGEDNTSSSESEKPTVCARCHALRNYGKVKDASVENLLPDFDFEHVVGSRLRKAVGRRAVVVMVIDSVDFDGSFPRAAAALLADAEKDLGSSWQEGKPGNIPRLIIVLNKVDLLPGQISPVRLEQWVRRRSRAGGVTQISGVHIVSAFKGWGVDKLCKQIAEMAGPRGDVWVIGAQNVGKSSLINAMGKLSAAGAERKNNVYLTEAALPGTTVGVLKLEGILPGRARLVDTPGLLHPHQITTRLTVEEQKMVQIRKVLKPRTFRVKVGHALSIGGLMRLTVDRAPADSIYATIWASAHIPCHMGKAETAQYLFDKHIGEKLQPPSSKERVADLGRWVARTVEVSGSKWDKSSVDVAVAGVGWIALALSGSARLEVWTYEGVAVTVRESIALDLAPVFERPGFTATKIPGKAKME